MADPDRAVRATLGGVLATLADLAALIERTGADLAMAEEPSNFAAALEAGAGDSGRD